MELLSVHLQCHLCCGSDSYGPCAYIWVQRWRWWKRNLQSCCWEKICQVVRRVSAQQWPFQMPSLTSLVHIHCCFRNKYFLICAPVCLRTFLLLFVQKLLFLCSRVSVLFAVDAASVFGALWRLEPFAAERRAMWRREMEWLLSVSDFIVELVPTCQRFPDGSTLEVSMTHRWFLFLL